MVKHIMYVRIPEIPDVLEQKHYEVPVYARGNNLMNIDPLKAFAKSKLADEFAHADEDIHRHFMDNAVVEKVAVESAPAEFLIVDVYAIQEMDNFDEVRGTASNFF